MEKRFSFSRVAGTSVMRYGNEAAEGNCWAQNLLRVEAVQLCRKNVFRYAEEAFSVLKASCTDRRNFAWRSPGSLSQQYKAITMSVMLLLITLKRHIGCPVILP